ncbi:hypothetical protein AB0M79_02875 [Polymorphospora sp. NPDC051019]|uniref:hypothetical protein n=1 Tax=Polymorphospora sp. NPDC051019 TaxID=3155725 RepID=UPI00343A4B10
MRLRPFVLVVALVAALVPATAGPARAAVANSWGFALVTDPTVPAWTTLDTTRQWGSWKTSAPDLWAEGGRTSAGVFQVRFPRIGSGSLGIAHVTPVDGTGNYCSVVQWWEVAPDQIVLVQCRAPGGVLTDTAFSVMWTYRVSYAPTATTYAYLHYRDQENRVVHSHSSLQGMVLAARSSTGSYHVRLYRVGVAGIPAGNLQVTAVQRQAVPRRCKVTNWMFEGTDILAEVSCFDHQGRLTWSDFTLSYHRGRSLTASLGTPQKFGYFHHWRYDANHNSVTGVGGNTISTVAPGRFTVRYPQLGVDQTHAQVVAEGPGPNYCNLARPWSHVGTDAELDVVCFDNAGNPVGSRMMAAFTSKT